MSNHQAEVIHHDLDCKCHRRREWIEIDGEMIPIEFSVDDPSRPPMSQEQKQKIAKLIKQALHDQKQIR